METYKLSEDCILLQSFPYFPLEIFYTFIKVFNFLFENLPFLCRNISIVQGHMNHEFIVFENICIETCLLYGLNASSYSLVIEIDNARLNITEIDYSIREMIVNDATEIIPAIKVEDKEGRDIVFPTIVNRSDGKFDLNLKPKEKKTYTIGEFLTLNLI